VVTGFLFLADPLPAARPYTLVPRLLLSFPLVTGPLTTDY